jgi:hypothetical protein
MSRYTTQTEFAFGKLQRDRAIIPDATASVVVECWTGTGWVLDENSPITKPSTIYTKGLRLRLTPTGGGFFLDGGDNV